MAPLFNQLHTTVDPVSTIGRNAISELPINPEEHEGHKDFNFIVDISSVILVYFLVKASHCYSSWVVGIVDDLTGFLLCLTPGIEKYFDLGQFSCARVGNKKKKQIAVARQRLPGLRNGP